MNKKLLLFFLLFLLLFTAYLSLCACGRNNKPININNTPIYSLHTEKVISIESDGILASNSASYYFATDNRGAVSLKKYIGAELISEQSLVLEQDEHLCFFEANESWLYLVTKKNCNESWNSFYSIIIFDVDLAIIQETDLPETVADDAIDFSMSENGSAYLLFEDSCVSLSFTDSRFNSSRIYADNCSFMGISAYESYCYLLVKDSELNYLIRKTDPDLSIEETFTLDISFPVYQINGLNSAYLWENPGFNIDGKIYLFREETNELTLAADLFLSGMSVYDNNCTCLENKLLSFGESKIIPYTDEYGIFESELSDSPDVNKYSLGIIYNDSISNIERQNRINLVVSSYNSTNTDNCFIEVEWIEDSDYRQLLVDISSGNGPDILCVSSDNLNELLDSDYIYPICLSETITDECIDGIIDSQEDNSRYFLAPWVYINGLTYKTELFGENLDAMSFLVNDIFQYNNGRVFRNNTPIDYINVFLPYFSGCNRCPDAEELSEIIETAYSINVENSECNSETRTLKQYIDSNEILFLTDIIDSYYTYLYYSALFDCNISTTGFPGFEGTTASSEDCFVLLEESSDGIQSFFEYLLTDEVQYNVAVNPSNGFVIPISENAFYEVISVAKGLFESDCILSSEIIYDGNEYNSFISRYMSDYEYSLYLEELQEVIDTVIDNHNNINSSPDIEHESQRLHLSDYYLAESTFVELVLNTNVFYVPNQDVAAVYLEEIPGFFDNQCPATDVAQVISERVNIILSENEDGNR